MLKLISLIIKSSLLPASLMVVGKVIGLYVAFNLLDAFPYITNEIGNNFSIHLYFNNPGETLAVNTISNLVMLIIIFIYVTVLFIQYYSKKAAETKPSTIYKMLDADLLDYVIKEGNNYIKIFVGSTFLIICCLTAGANAFNGVAEEWLIWVCAGLLFVTIWGIIRISDIEMNKFYPSEDNKAWK